MTKIQIHTSDGCLVSWTRVGFLSVVYYAGGCVIHGEDTRKVFVADFDRCVTPPAPADTGPTW